MIQDDPLGPAAPGNENIGPVELPDISTMSKEKIERVEGAIMLEVLQAGNWKSGIESWSEYFFLLSKECDNLNSFGLLSISYRLMYQALNGFPTDVQTIVGGAIKRMVEFALSYLSGEHGPIPEDE